MLAKGSGWAAVSGEAPVKFATGDIVMFPQGDRYVISSAPDVAPMQYLASWRIQVGARMLRDSNRNAATIAHDVGYESEAAFSRAFKRMVGQPPAAWRKAQLTR